MSASDAPAFSAEDAPALFRFEGSIPPRRIPFAYRVTLALTAFAMVLLPLAYVALVAAAAYGVYTWAIYGLFLFSGSGGGLVKIAAYIAPLFAGGTLIVFMIKPLFARPAKRAEPFTLDLNHYPELRRLIAEICVKVGAPMPVRVDLDCQVNASAHLRRGLLSLGRRDLVLTIGLPLIQGLSARQFAGVLAHEFGHFAQGAGMAFTFVIRSINAWFARVVFERDRWDATLASWSEGGDFRIAIVVGLARAAVWLSRKVLHGLMIIGHAITCLQLRQMEFDADYYEIQLAGSEEFVATSREFSRLNAAAAAAFNDLGELWQTRQLVNDFPDFVLARRSQLNADTLAKIDENTLSAKTGWLDTHPSNRDRNAAATRLGLRGILRCEVPARLLLPDLADLARAATRHFYRGHLGLTIDDNSLVSTESAARAGAAAAASDAARTRLVGTVLDLTRPIIWQEPDFSPAADATPVALGAALTAKRSDIDRQRELAMQNSTTFSSILEHLLLIEQAHALLSVGAKITPRTFHLLKSDLQEAETERAELKRRLTAKQAELAPFETAVHDWVALLGQAARAAATEHTRPPQLRTELRQLTTSLAALSPWFEAFPGWHRQHTVLSVFFANHKTLAENQSFVSALGCRFEEAARVGDTAPTLVGDAPYPLATADGVISAATLLRNALEGSEGATRLIVVMQTVANAYFRILSRIIALGEKVETMLDPSSTSRSEGSLPTA